MKNRIQINVSIEDASIMLKALQAQNGTLDSRTFKLVVRLNSLIKYAQIKATATDN